MHAANSVSKYLAKEVCGEGRFLRSGRYIFTNMQIRHTDHLLWNNWVKLRQKSFNDRPDHFPLDMVFMIVLGTTPMQQVLHHESWKGVNTTAHMKQMQLILEKHCISDAHFDRVIQHPNLKTTWHRPLFNKKIRFFITPPVGKKGVDGNQGSSVYCRNLGSNTCLPNYNSITSYW